mmetsp:Transcript_65807/g.169383  ORF Transcript_65807/g.169383 Transcript_65807/m.169383 type:complete len:202 (+) Transcript_65807:9-614(+)
MAGSASTSSDASISTPIILTNSLKLMVPLASVSSFRIMLSDASFRWPSSSTWQTSAAEISPSPSRSKTLKAVQHVSRVMTPQPSMLAAMNSVKLMTPLLSASTASMSSCKSFSVLKRPAFCRPCLSSARVSEPLPSTSIAMKFSRSCFVSASCSCPAMMNSAAFRSRFWPLYAAHLSRKVLLRLSTGPAGAYFLIQSDCSA